MKYGLIGKKLTHSFSKPIHEQIADYKYELKELSEQELDLFMREKSFLGINVTIPYKRAVIPYLDFIDENAERIGAVNTIVNKDGKLYGYNTDFGGMKMLIEKSGFDYKDKKVLILGSGGTSKTANAVASALGAKEIIIVSRNGKINYENVYTLCADADYIINTTPCGMYPDNFSSPIDVSRFIALSGVTDVVYNPLKTALCLQCEKLGVKCECGLYMLVAQAVLAAQFFTGTTIDCEKVTEDIYNDIKKQKRNIVLVGMPGSGKSTVGKVLRKETQRYFLDTDKMIVASHGDISEIFKNHGEAYFREIETQKIKEVSVKTGCIIATGGGAILKQENVDALKQNGIIVFLNRPLENIMPTSDRPLSSDRSALEKRFEERYEKYLSCCDLEIMASGTVEEVVSLVMEMTL